MGPRKALGVVTENPAMDLHERCENLRARQLDLRVVMEQTQQELRDDIDRKHAEFIQMLSSLKHSIDGTHLYLQSKDKQVAENQRLFQKLKEKLSENWVKSEDSYSVLIESAEVLEDVCLNVIFMENGSYNDIDSLEDTFMSELFMENESWNIARKMLDKMPKSIYDAVESDLDALDDMCLSTLFNEAERITNAHKFSDGMTGRDHVKVVHVFVINESKFSLVLVGNEMVLPLWDPGIGLNGLTSVKLASQTNDVREKLMDFFNKFCLPRSSDDLRRVWDTGWQWFMYPKIVDIKLRNVDCWEVVLMAFCYKWHMVLKGVTLPVEQRDGRKNYISEVIVKLSSDEASLRREKLYVSKLNITLAHILKHEWPARWRSFLPDLVAAAKTSEIICENCMTILKLLSEEVFDFSRGEMTQQKIKELKQSLHSEFQLIHELCMYVLSTFQRTELIRATLATLHAFLSWVPVGYIFESPLLETLLKYFPMPAYRNPTLQCLTEVAVLNFGDFYNIQYVKMYNIFMVQLQTILPPNSNIPEAYANGSTEEQAFIQNLALFFTSFFKSHIRVLETSKKM
ncbi:protein exportin 1a [Nicotiana attenuata]|uniref:Protein exportin 1a n=1 Tax=Nicotiana attenuata TaxID=49451 RepID=A0A1J6KD59_NICAT|nr:protein exportin 1a [Nicotiana attenuata]